MKMMKVVVVVVEEIQRNDERVSSIDYPERIDDQWMKVE